MKQTENKKEVQTKKTKKQKVKKQRIKYPVSFKLIMIFASLVIFALGTTTIMVSKLFTSDVEVRAQDNNLEINSQTANTIQNVFLNVQSDTNGYLNYLLLIQQDEFFMEKANVIFQDLCVRNPEIQFLYTSSLDLNLAPEFLISHPNAEEVFMEWMEKNKDMAKSALSGNVEIKNVSNLFEDIDLFLIMFSHENPISGEKDLVCVTFDPETPVNNLIELCNGKANTTFLVNKNADALIYEDFSVIKNCENIGSKKLVSESIKNSSLEGKQIIIKDDDDVEWLCACKTIIGDMVVVTRVQQSIVYESVLHSTIRTLLVSVAVFFMTILIIRFFSKTLTNPIADLVDATNQIDAGNYDIELKPSTQDEIGALTKSFVNMTGGLKQRQRLMSSFSKFTNHVIAEKAANGELSVGGESKNATVFFSDIRSFTAMSEKMTPEQVVEFLNDYFTRMVDCVNKTNGIVDKFIGDAVMAVWGAATTNGSPQADAWAAVKAALMMRIALYHFNQNQLKHGRNTIKIGCGINSGPIVAGQIGSNDHMNYTVIGDTVNLASRTEALNKPFATDILITENTYKLIKDKVIVEEMPGVHVKGKEDAIKMYAVINAVGVKGPADIHKLREFLGWDEPQDLSKVNTDEEEKKYKIGSK